jgi:quinol monooxygenase YgiN
MIILMGTIGFGPGEIDRLLDGFAVHLAKTRAADGCEFFAFSRDLHDPDLMHIAERWRDAAALQAHSEAAHMADFSAMLSTSKMVSISMKSYDGDIVTTIIGD